VPTGLATNGDYVYSAEFSGFPFVAGSADIYRTDATGTTSLFATGFTSISDIAFGPEGDLYILEYATNFFDPAPSGNLLRLSADGLSRDLLATGLTRPTGLAVDARGRVYVANNGDGTNGELLRLTREVPGPLPILGLAAAFRQARQLRRRIALQAERPEA
jgi:glucose/arabinose dehydrogenase